MAREIQQSAFIGRKIVSGKRLSASSAQFTLDDGTVILLEARLDHDEMFGYSPELVVNITP